MFRSTTLIALIALCGCAWAESDDSTTIAAESFTLKDGRELVGIYDENKGQLKLVDKKTGKVNGSVFVKPDQIVTRTPAPIVTDNAKAKKDLPGTNGEWTDNYPEAVKAAQATKRLILIDFTGSDWCGWCMKLHKEVFDTKEFKEWAAQNVVLVEADFPHKKALSAETKKQNDGLNAKYGIEGFPTIVVVDAAGKERTRSGYLEGGPKAWIEDLAGKAGLKKK